MVFLELETTNATMMEVFYTETLGVFKLSSISNRLVCSSGIDFIIDLKSVSKKPITGINFGLFHEGVKINALSRIKEMNLEHEFSDNKAGAILRIKDPEGNLIFIRSGNAEIY